MKKVLLAHKYSLFYQPLDTVLQEKSQQISDVHIIYLAVFKITAELSKLPRWLNSDL